jgi:hypothetical protein
MVLRIGIMKLMELNKMMMEVKLKIEKIKGYTDEQLEDLAQNILDRYFSEDYFDERIIESD